MPLVESKRFLTKPLKIYAISQFMIYMSVFYLAYTMSGFEFENTTTKWIIIFTAIVIAYYTALQPALVRNAIDSIRLKRELNYAYFAPVLSVGVILLYLFSVFFHRGDIAFEHRDALRICWVYLTCTPLPVVILTLLSKSL